MLSTPLLIKKTHTWKHLYYSMLRQKFKPLWFVLAALASVRRESTVTISNKHVKNLPLACLSKKLIFFYTSKRSLKTCPNSVFTIQYAEKNYCRCSIFEIKMSYKLHAASKSWIESFSEALFIYMQGLLWTIMKVVAHVKYAYLYWIFTVCKRQKKRSRFLMTTQPDRNGRNVVSAFHGIA